MQQTTTSKHPNPTVEIAVYTGSNLYGLDGREPEQIAVEFLAQALDLVRLNYDIHHDLPVETVPSRTGVCQEPFDTWNARVRNENVPVVAQDVNLLAIDGRAGGCSNNPDNDPNRCTFGATPITGLNGYELGGTSLAHSSANALLHEVGHNLGFPHQPHGGYGFDAIAPDGTQRWHRTPTVGSNAVDNECGEYIEARDQSTSYRYLFWHWCMQHAIRLPGREVGTRLHDGDYPPTYDGQRPHNYQQLSQPGIDPPDDSDGNGDGNGDSDPDPGGDTPDQGDGSGAVAGGAVLGLIGLGLLASDRDLSEPSSESDDD